MGQMWNVCAHQPQSIPPQSWLVILRGEDIVEETKAERRLLGLGKWVPNLVFAL
jgi:hypothetical protein